MGVVMSEVAAFVADLHIIYLANVSRTGDVFTFTFRTTAPGAADFTLVFTRDLADPEFSIEEVEAPPVLPVSSSSSSSSSSVATPPTGPLSIQDCRVGSVWEGYLVTGPLDDLADVLLDGESESFTVGQWQLEHSRIQDLSQNFVQSLNLANFDRTHVTDPEGCESSSASSVATDPTFINATCLIGDRKLIEGYNCSIRQEVVTNSIVIEAIAGAGAGDPCDEVPLYDGEIPPAGSTLLTGGPACNEIIKTIEGVGGANFTMLEGPGVRIFRDAFDVNKLNVDFDLHDFAICPPRTEAEAANKLTARGTLVATCIKGVAVNVAATAQGHGEAVSTP